MSRKFGVPLIWPESWAISRDVADRDTWAVYETRDVGKPNQIQYVIFHIQWEAVVELFGLDHATFFAEHFDKIDRQGCDRAKRLLWPSELVGELRAWEPARAS